MEATATNPKWNERKLEFSGTYSVPSALGLGFFLAPDLVVLPFFGGGWIENWPLHVCVHARKNAYLDCRVIWLLV